MREERVPVFVHLFFAECAPTKSSSQQTWCPAHFNKMYIVKSIRIIYLFWMENERNGKIQPQ